MKKNDVGLNFKSAINGFNREDVNHYIANMKHEFHKVCEEKEDELLTFKNLNLKISEQKEEEIKEKEHQIKYLNVQVSGLNTQIESMEQTFKEECEKFEIIRMNLEKELNEKSSLGRFELDQIKDEMIAEIEYLRREVEVHQHELKELREVHQMLQNEKMEIEHEKLRLEANVAQEIELLEMTLEREREQFKLQIEALESELLNLQTNQVVAVNSVQSEQQTNKDKAFFEAQTKEIEALRASVSQAMSERDDAKNEVGRLKSQLNETDDNKNILVNILVSAQKQSDDMLAKTKEHTMKMLEEAHIEKIRIEEKAKLILEEANLKATEEIMRAEMQVKLEKEKLTAVRKEIKDMRESMLNKLNAYKDGLDQMMVYDLEKDKTVIPMREIHG